MARTALITGATGLLGRQVATVFERRDWHVVRTGWTRANPPDIMKLDLGAESEVKRIIEEVKPQVVVHCAANRFPDKCDADPAAARALNVSSSDFLAQICAARSVMLIYISTDYVFPGTPGEAPYEADSTPAPSNLYGQTKRHGEEVVVDAYQQEGWPHGVVVLRVPVLYGSVETPAESAVNVLVDAVWKAQDPKTCVTMDHWAIRYPTNTEDVGRVCHDIAATYLEREQDTAKGGSPRPLPRILQFSSEDRYTKYEMCELFARILGLPLDNMAAASQGPDPNASVQRPYDCHLSTKALRDIGIDVSTQDFEGWWRREMRAFRK